MPNLKNLNSFVPDDVASAFAPLLVPVEDAFRALGIGRTTGYGLIRDGHLIARKIGSRTVVEAASIRHFAASLPRAEGRLMQRPPNTSDAGSEMLVAPAPTPSVRVTRRPT